MKLRRRTVLSLLVVGVLAMSGIALAADSFTDVPNDHLFHDDIQWMKDNDITRGCNPPDNTLYCPDENVTRGQMAAFMHRLALNVEGEKGSQGQQGPEGPRGEPGPPGQALIAHAITDVNENYSSETNEVRVVDVPGDSGGPDGFTQDLVDSITLDAGTYKVEGVVQFFDFLDPEDGSVEYGLSRTFLNAEPVGTMWTPDIPEDGNNAAMASGSQILEVTEDDSVLEVKVLIRGDGKEIAGQAGGNIIVTQFNE